MNSNNNKKKKGNPSFSLYHQYQSLLHQIGTVSNNPLRPYGYVKLGDELYDAVAKNEPIPAHSSIEVVEICSHILYVKKLNRRQISIRKVF